MIGELRAAKWEVLVEYSFNHYRDRGTVDVEAWHAATRTLLIIEVKTRVADIQELIGRLDIKCRVVPPLLRRERGWEAARPGRMLVLAESRMNRRAVEQHEDTFSVVCHSGRSRRDDGCVSRPARWMRSGSCHLWPGDIVSKEAAVPAESEWIGAATRERDHARVAATGPVPR